MLFKEQFQAAILSTVKLLDSRLIGAKPYLNNEEQRASILETDIPLEGKVAKLYQLELEKCLPDNQVSSTPFNIYDDKCRIVYFNRDYDLTAWAKVKRAGYMFILKTMCEAGIRKTRLGPASQIQNTHEYWSSTRAADIINGVIHAVSINIKAILNKVLSRISRVPDEEEEFL